MKGYKQSPDLAKRGAELQRRIDERKSEMGSRWLGYTVRQRLDVLKAVRERVEVLT